MLIFSKVQQLAPQRGGRPPAYEQLTPQQAKVEAYKILQRGLSTSEAHVIDVLSVAGVLPSHHLGVSKNTRSKYLADRLLDRLPFSSEEIHQAFSAYGIPLPTDKDVFLYTLGPVGIEIARERHEMPPPMGFLAYTLERVMHDVAVNEIVFSLGTRAHENDWDLSWFGKYESTLYRDGTPILEPDAFFVLRKGEQELPFALEYHNEGWRTRGASKVRRYEMACSDTDLWMETWGVDTFPRVLAVYRKSVVGKGYAEGVAEYEGRGKCAFYGRSLAAALKAEPEWYDFAARRREKIFPWEQKGGEAGQ